MSKVLKTVAVVALAVAVVVFAPQIAGILASVAGSLGVTLATAALTSTIIGMGLTLALTATMSLFRKAPSMSQSMVDRLNTSVVPTAPRKIVFGSTAGGADVRFFEGELDLPSTKKDGYVQVIALASHRISAFKQFYVENDLVYQNGSWLKHRDGFSSSNPLRIVTEGKPGNGFAVGTGRYWKSSASFTGCAYYVPTWKLDTDVWESGIPQRLTAIVDGCPLYDPRRDSTRGGAGSHRFGTQDTYTFNEGGTVIGRNPALALLTYLIGWRINGKLVWGMGIPAHRIDLDNFRTYANLCEERVATQGGGTVQRYTADAIYSTSDSHDTVINSLTAAMGSCKLTDRGGTYCIVGGYDDTAGPKIEFTADDLVAPANGASPYVWNPAPASRERFNIVRGRFANPDELYQLTDWGDPIEQPPLADGVPRTLSLDLGAVSRAETCQRIAKQFLLREYLCPGMFSATFGPKAFAVEIGSVITLSLPAEGWNNKLFRVMEQSETHDLFFQMTLREEDPAIYAWDREEKPLPVSIRPQGYDAKATITPEGLALTSASYAGANGINISEVHVSWTPENSGRVNGIQIQSRPAGADGWTEQAAIFDPRAGSFTFTSNAPGITVEVRARYRMTSAVYSPWVQANVATAPVQINYGDVEDAPKDLNELDPAQGDKLNGIQPGATVGAPDGTYIGGVTQPDGSNVGGIPAAQLSVKIADITKSLSDLGDIPESMEIIENAAANAQQAASDAQAAVTLANGAKDDALKNAGNAQASATKATSAAGDAQSYAAQASTSKQDAEGFANSAAIQAGVAATSKQAAIDVAASQMPRDFAQDGLFFSESFQGTRAPLSSTWTFPSVSGLGKVAQHSGGAGLSTVGSMMSVQGRRYRATVRTRVINNPSNQPLKARVYVLVTDPVSLAYVAGISADHTYSEANTWYDATVEWTATGRYAIHPRADLATIAATGAAAPADVVQVSALFIEDITSETASKGHADAAATSAATAATRRNEAESFASAAQTAKTNAETAAGNALTYRDEASTSSQNAKTSENNASLSSGAAATASHSAKIVAEWPQDFSQKGLLYTGAGMGATPVSLADSFFVAESGVNILTTSQTLYLYFFRKLIGAAGRRYLVQGRVRANGVNGSYSPNWEAGNVGAGASFGSFAGFATVPVSAGWINFEYIIEPAGAAQVYPVLNPGIYLTPGAGGSMSVQYFRATDITESFNANTAAQAASTSAQTATTKATEAGTSAEAARTYRDQAQTFSGNASGFATSAQTSAATATDKAAAAAQSATLSASITPGTVNNNPHFAMWATPGLSGFPAGPDYWNPWNFSGVCTKAPGLTAQNAARVTANAGGSCGMLARAPGFSTGTYILEAVIRLNSGTLQGAGVHVHPLIGARASNTGNQDFKEMAFITAKDELSGRVAGDGVAGTLYRFSKVVTFTVPADQFGIYAMSHYGGGTFGPISAANDITWYYVGVRSATEADTLGYKAAADLNIMSGVLAELGRQSAVWQVAPNVGGSAATSFITVQADISRPEAAPFTPYNAQMVGGLGTTENMILSGRTLTRTAERGSSWYAAGFTTAQSYGPGAYTACSPPTANTAAASTMWGLTSGNFSVPYYGYDQLAAAWHFDANIRQAFIFQAGGTVGNFGNYKLSDTFSIEYSNDTNGTFTYRKNGTIVFTQTNMGVNRVFRAQGSLYGQPASLRNLVFGPAAPSVTSSVAIGAKEIALYNTEDGTNAKLAMRVTKGNAAFTGNIYAGGKVILGNDETGWELAIKPRTFQVSDGTAVSWPNVGYIPNYTISSLGLAPVATNESYRLYLDSISSTGAIVRLKINVPGTTSNVSVTGSTATGGTPARRIGRGSTPESSNGFYTFSGYVTSTAQAYVNNENVSGAGNRYAADFMYDVALYGLVGGVWTIVGYYSDSETIYYGTGGAKTSGRAFTRSVTIPAGVTAFGTHGASLFDAVYWSAQTGGSGERTATPNGQSCQLTVSP